MLRFCAGAPCLTPPRGVPPTKQLICQQTGCQRCKDDDGVGLAAFYAHSFVAFCVCEMALLVKRSILKVNEEPYSSEIVSAYKFRMVVTSISRHLSRNDCIYKCISRTVTAVVNREYIGYVMDKCWMLYCMACLL